MEILIHIKAKKADGHYLTGMNEYIKRMSPFAFVKPVFYKDLKKASTKEGSYVILVSPTYKMLSSPELAEKINEICVAGFSRIEFIISNEPLDMECDFKFGITYMELDMELSAVALTEQLYRSFTILNNITYHKYRHIFFL